MANIKIAFNRATAQFPFSVPSIFLLKDAWSARRALNANMTCFCKPSVTHELFLWAEAGCMSLQKALRLEENRKLF